MLLEELHVLNVHPSIIRWIGAFLCKRSQRVRVGKSLSSSPVSPRGGIPQGTKLAPLLFAILVNRLATTWPCRLKYVDDTTVFEAIPRCSPSYLPFIVNDISCFSSLRGMRLNPKKCKVMDINFLQYQPGPLAPITIKGCPVHQVQTYKLLGVHVAHDLSWNTHIEHIVTKASKRLYALRLLRKSGVACADLVSIYCALIRSVLEYAAPVWAALPLYLDNLIESVQQKALRIIFPAVGYNSALYQSGLKTLNERRKEICTNFISYVRGNGLEPICSSLPAIVNHPLGYGLRSGNTSQSRPRANTDRLGNFITYKYA